MTTQPATSLIHTGCVLWDDLSEKSVSSRFLFDLPAELAAAFEKLFKAVRGYLAQLEQMPVLCARIELVLLKPTLH